MRVSFSRFWSRHRRRSRRPRLGRLPHAARSIASANRPIRSEGRPCAPGWTPPKPDRIALGPRNVAGQFLVKFVEGSHVRLGMNGFPFTRRLRDRAPGQSSRLARFGLGGAPGGAAGLDTELAAFSEIARRYEASHGFRPGYAFRPDQPRNGVDAQFAERDALEMRSGEELADLDLYYVFQAPNFSDQAAQERFMNVLNGFRLVEQVTPLVLASVPTITADASSRQDYLGPAPRGIDAISAWTRRGGLGDGVRICRRRI